MSRKLPLIALSFAFLASIPSLVAAEAQKYPVDPTHTQVGFTVRHFLSTVPGRFNEFEGTVWVDPKNVAKTLKISGKVKTASIDTNVEKRDDHLRSADFFDAEAHPVMTFESKSVKKKGDKYAVTTDLTIRGVTKEVVFDAEVLGFMDNPFTGTPMTALDLTGTIDRQEFGVSWSKVLDKGAVVVGDDVKITIHIEATIPPEKQS